jgi:hypothetical protein
MPKFTLIAQHLDYQGKSNGHKITYEFEVDHISAVLENVDYFIRGVGYHPEGTLDYVLDNDYYGDGHDGMGTTLDDWTETIRVDAQAENPWPEAHYGHDLKQE